jgi:uncharacterized protein YigA (DUF484 family)
LAVSLARAGRRDERAVGAVCALGGGFAIPHVAVRLWDVPHDPAALESQPVSAAVKDYVLNLQHPYCGAVGGIDAAEWFGEDGQNVRSLAIVPLRDEGAAFGFLALGSEEAERFYPGMGTLYLERIGELASAALMRTCAIDG